MKINRGRVLATIALTAGLVGATLAAQSASTTTIAPAAKVTLGADITSLASLSGSPYVAAGLTNGQVVLWNGRDAEPGLTLKPHTTRVLALSATADGQGIWSVAADGSLGRTALTRDAQAVVKRLETGTAPLRAAAFSFDGAIVVTGGDRGEILVFDTTSGAVKHRLQGHRTELHSLAMRPESLILASASAETDLRIWNLATGREVLSIDSDVAFFALAFSPRDGTLASGGVNRRLTLHDPQTMKPTGTLDVQKPGMVAALAWSPNGRTIALGDLDDETLSKGGLRIVDAGSRTVLAFLETGGAPASAVTFVSGSVAIAALRRDLRAWELPPPGR
jgi:WD40 repeat protein